MTLLKICGIVVIFLIFCLILPKGKGNLSVIVGISMCLLIVISGIDNIFPIFEYVNELTKKGALLGKYTPVLFKAMGIGFVCSAMSGICRENGESSVAACVEFFGKGEMLVCALPVFKDLLALAIEAGGQ